MSLANAEASYDTAVTPGDGRRTSAELPTLAEWRCERCGRGINDGARPEAIGTSRNGPAVARTGRTSARMCSRCRGRVRRGSKAAHIPPDAPAMVARTPAEVTLRRAYWERRLFDAALRLADYDTDEEADEAFRLAYFEFLATAAYAGRFLQVSDYTTGDRGTNDVVPGRRDVPPCGCGE